MLSPLKLLHLRFICGVETDAEIPWIWIEVFQAPTKADALSVLSQYMCAGREVCRRDLFFSKDILHVCGDLFMFVHRDRFVNPQHDPDCPTGGVSFWTTRQDGGNVGEKIASTEGAITALDSAKVRHEEVTSVTQKKLAVMVDLLTAASER